LAQNAIDPAEAVYPFDVTPEMEIWVDDVLYGNVSKTSDTKLDIIQQAMFGKDFDFEYAEGLTLTAAEAFEQRRGNCMSFTALFVALARTAGIDAYLLSVRRSPEVDKEDDLVVINHHVVAAHRSPRQVNVYDFYVSKSEPFIQQRVVDDVLASAMYHNNMGGLAIREGDLAEAERNLRISTKLAPNWPPAWINLGVAKFRSGDSEGALMAYRKVLELDPSHPSALTNMAFVYRQLGWEEEANTVLRAAAHRSNNPFTLIALADVEMFRSDFDKAADYLRRARLWYRSEPEVWDAMARLARHRGKDVKAEKYVTRAGKLRLRQEDSNG
jgi:Flp pilus assembly protein TadD